MTTIKQRIRRVRSNDCCPIGGRGCPCRSYFDQEALAGIKPYLQALPISGREASRIDVGLDAAESMLKAHWNAPLPVLVDASLEPRAVIVRTKQVASELPSNWLDPTRRQLAFSRGLAIGMVVGELVARRMLHEGFCSPVPVQVRADWPEDHSTIVIGRAA